MAKLKIVKHGDETLRKVCRPVDKITPRIITLLDDMIETMNDAEGVGLAAPQVGVLRRVCVIDVGEGPVEMVNPVILESSGEQGGMEGCLSFPGESGYVVRPNRVRVEAYDRHGDLYEYEGEGLFARAVFHETDHLDGKLFIDYLSPVRREMLMRKVKKLKK